ncbi:MAG TPA: ferritin-like domain-containing protein [Polyangia bacterium]|nr:ferritin-like domain-containing protein [Polyangia bacterium]
MIAAPSDRDATADVAWMAREAERRRRRAAPSRRRAPAFDPTPYASSALERARRLWTARATAEHESALIVAGLLPFALEARASVDTQTVIAGMAEDEMRHARICADVARALGGEPAAPSRPPVLPRSARPVEEQFLAHAIFGHCLAETVNVARLVDASEHARDAFLREAILALLADEIRHARFGFVLLTEWEPWLQAHPDSARALDAFLPAAFADLEARLSGAGGSRDGYGDDDRALGSPDPARLPETFYVTVEQAIVPGLQRLGLAASAAWQGRQRASR